jgi:hypothetical protein
MAHGTDDKGSITAPGFARLLARLHSTLGKEIKGEGLVGLTRGFMYAGAPRVVASLWQVSNLATADLMKKFYAGLLQGQLPAAAALRSAQLEMAKRRAVGVAILLGGVRLAGRLKVISCRVERARCHLSIPAP